MVDVEISKDEHQLEVGMVFVERNRNDGDEELAAVVNDYFPVESLIFEAHIEEAVENQGPLFVEFFLVPPQ